MKIYNKIVFDMTSDNLDVIEEDYHIYEGPVAKCAIVGDIITGSIRDIEQIFSGEAQIEDIFLPPHLFGEGGVLGSQEEFELPKIPSLPPRDTSFEEFQLLQQGFRRGPNGIEEISDDELDAIVGGTAAARIKNERAIGLLGQERTLAALEGNLPVSPALERDIRGREQQTLLGLRRGAGVESTAGIQKLGQQQESADIVRERVRTGEVTSGQAQNILQQRLLGNQQSQILEGIQRGQFGEGQLRFQQQDLNTQIQLANLAGRYGQQAGQQQLLGQLGTLGILAYAASDRRLKENIKKLGSATEIIEQMDPVSFNYKSDGRSSIGFIAQDLQKILPEAVVEIDDKGTLGIDYSVVTAVLIKAFQEFKNKSENL